MSGERGAADTSTQEKHRLVVQVTFDARRLFHARVSGSVGQFGGCLSVSVNASQLVVPVCV